MGEKKDPIIIYMEDFLLCLSFGVLLASVKVVLASQTLKCMILQEAFLIVEPGVPKLTKYCTSSNSELVGCKKILPYYRFMWLLEPIKFHTTLFLAPDQILGLTLKMRKNVK